MNFEKTITTINFEAHFNLHRPATNVTWSATDIAELNPKYDIDQRTEDVADVIVRAGLTVAPQPTPD